MAPTKPTERNHAAIRLQSMTVWCLGFVSLIYYSQRSIEAHEVVIMACIVAVGVFTDGVRKA